jgi:hypothetical protein
MEWLKNKYNEKTMPNDPSKLKDSQKMNYILNSIKNNYTPLMKQMEV